CSVIVELDPSSSASNPQLGKLTVSGASINLSGSYAGGANLTVDSNSNPAGSCGEACGPDFWGSFAVGDNPMRSYWITNTGDARSPALTPLFNFATPFSTGSSPSDCTSMQLSLGLLPGEQCSLSVVFTPPAASSGGMYSGAVGVGAGGANLL